MTFEEILDQAAAMLERRGRLTYGALKRQFQLDDDYLADLKAELIDGQRVAVDEDGKVLVWAGEGINGETEKRINGKGDRQLSVLLLTHLSFYPFIRFPFSSLPIMPNDLLRKLDDAFFDISPGWRNHKLRQSHCRELP